MDTFQHLFPQEMLDIYDRLPIGIYIINAMGTVLYLSSAMARLSGVPRDIFFWASIFAGTPYAESVTHDLIDVNQAEDAVAPAMIDTDMMRSVPENLLKTYVTLIPARRPGSVDELAATAPFLGSDDSSFVNGIVLPVNGGMFT